ncbi:MAG: hypothetical protein HUU50_20640 [Candidatus Brocadiae bacterium]|nr:hypothetical protein [Candidatus Brocadiia bacterium]
MHQTICAVFFISCYILAGCAGENPSQEHYIVERKVSYAAQEKIEKEKNEDPPWMQVYLKRAASIEKDGGIPSSQNTNLVNGTHDLDIASIPDSGLEKIKKALIQQIDQIIAKGQEPDSILLLQLLQIQRRLDERSDKRLYDNL